MVLKFLPSQPNIKQFILIGIKYSRDLSPNHELLHPRNKSLEKKTISTYEGTEKVSI